MIPYNIIIIHKFLSNFVITKLWNMFCQNTDMYYNCFVNFAAIIMNS